jgi:cytochrome c
MNFELNKIFGAVLGVLIFVMGSGFIASGIYSPERPKVPGAVIEVVETPAPGGQTDAPPAEPIAARLAKANIEKGDNLHKSQCLSCHGFDKGAANKQGPGLWGIVGNPKAKHDGFDYSEAFKKLAEAGEVWGYEQLDGFLANPRKYTPGTKMTYKGIDDPQARADLIAWLRAQDDAPEALPAP